MQKQAGQAERFPLCKPNTHSAHVRREEHRPKPKAAFLLLVHTFFMQCRGWWMVFWASRLAPASSRNTRNPFFHSAYSSYMLAYASIRRHGSRSPAGRRPECAEFTRNMGSWPQLFLSVSLMCVTPSSCCSIYNPPSISISQDRTQRGEHKLLVSVRPSPDAVPGDACLASILT